MRQLTYAQAIREAHAQLLEMDSRVFLFGQGLWSPWYAGTSLKDIDREFGRHRVLDSPVSENATTGAAIGAAIVGMRPIVFHPRMDFMLLASDPIVNQAANWSYLFGGQVGVPVVIRSVINRGGEQGAQHSQALQAMFTHVPGLKVVMPGTPYDAKGLLVAAVYDGNPVMYIDDRWLYGEIGEVPEELYSVPIGKAVVRREGKDVTVAAISWMAQEALKAADSLQTEGIEAEVIDLRSLKPLDEVMIIESVKKTGKLVIADGGWKTCGIASEIAALASTDAFEYLKAPVLRVTLPDCPAPMSSALEDCYYPKAADVVMAVRQVIGAAVGR